MSQLQDMQAIDDMFRRTAPKNSTSAAIKTSWRNWYDSLSSYHRSSSTDTFKEAKKRRDAFFKADAEKPSASAPKPPPTAKPMADKPTILVPGPRPTLRRGIHKTTPSSRPYVVEWQTVIKVNPDGAFGPDTENATKSWQRTRGLDADGIVGPKTWSRAQLEATQALAQPQNIVDAAQQAAQAVSAAGTAATQAAATQTSPVAQAAAAAAAGTQSLLTSAAQAANVAAGKPPAPTTKPKPPKPPASTTSSTASVVDTATHAVQTVRKEIQKAANRTPVWVKAIAVTGGVFAGLIGLKAVTGGKRRSAA